MSNLKPLADKIVVERIEAVEKTASGIVIPDSAKEKPEQGKVISVGKDVKEVKKGDEVLFAKYSPTEVKIDAHDYLLVKEEDILAIVS